MQGVSGDAFQNMSIMEYAPADFPDSETTRPAESYLDAGTPFPGAIFSSVMDNTFRTHFREISNAHISPGNIVSSWKKKIRDIFLRGNESILSFLTKTACSHPTIGQVENLIRRYGRNDFHHAPNQLLKDILSDLSGVDATSFLVDRLRLKQQEDAISCVAQQVQEVYVVYRELMEQITQTDLRIRQKLNILDKIQPRLVQLLDLGVNQTTQELQKNIETYLKKVYDENNPEAEYKELLVLYKKFMTVRDLVSLFRVSTGPEREPICGICLDGTVSHVLVPCGHTYCDTCVRRQGRHCFVCRQNSSQAIKIFFT